MFELRKGSSRDKDRDRDRDRGRGGSRRKAESGRPTDPHVGAGGDVGQGGSGSGSGGNAGGNGTEAAGGGRGGGGGGTGGGSGGGGSGEGSMTKEDMQRMISAISGDHEGLGGGGASSRGKSAGATSSGSAAATTAAATTPTTTAAAAGSAGPPPPVSPKADSRRAGEAGGNGSGRHGRAGDEDGADDHLKLRYYENVDELRELQRQIAEALQAEKSIRDGGKREKSRQKRLQMEKELSAKKKRSRKGEFPLIKGRTKIVIPESPSAAYQTSYAFEIHTKKDKRAKAAANILTICCDQSKDRSQFIEKIKHALLSKSDIEKLQGYLTEEEKGRIRAFHSALEQQRRQNTTKNIVQRYPAPFVTRKGSQLRGGGGDRGSQGKPSSGGWDRRSSSRRSGGWGG